MKDQINSGNRDFASAHDYLYTKYSGQLGGFGYNDAQIKAIAHKALGGK